jgi:hypothetical protein
MPYVSKVKDEKQFEQYIIGFPRGVNTTQDKALVNDKNLIQGDNVMIVVDGITRRYGSEKVFDQGSASYVYGAGAYYNKAAGTKKFLRVANSRLQYLNGSVWSDIGSTAYSSIMTTILQVYNRAYIHNGTDSLTYTDGTSITTYTTLTTPTGLTVTPTGSAGTTAYSYRISAFNSTGETAACAAVATATGNATLSSTNYNALAWDAVANSTGYNVYGRTATGTQEVYLATVDINSYNDTGDDVTIVSKPATTENTTGGIKAKHAIFAMGRQFVCGVTEGSTYYPTRMYYSGTISHIDDFSVGTYGGGWVEIYANDGGEIMDLMPYQSGVLVFKTNGIFYFYFTSTGEAALKEITRSQGGVSYWGAQAIENNIIYVGQKENRIGVWTVGTQANYGSDEIRTNELSVFITPSLTNINRTYMSKICTFSYDNKFGFSYTVGSGIENTEGWVFDLQFGGWVHWDGDPMEVSQYVVYDDGIDAKLYGCGNQDGYMIELMKSARNDNGLAFKSLIGTKFYNQERYDVEKIYRNPSLWFKYINAATIRTEVWFNNIDFSGSGTITSIMNGAGLGIDLCGVTLPGDSYATITVTDLGSQDDIIKELTVLKLARNIGIYLSDETLNSNWIFMGMHIVYTPLIGKPPSDLEKITLTQ